MNALINLIIILAVLIVAWLVVARFSPDPLITIIFIIALVVVLRMILPLAGVSF